MSENVVGQTVNFGGAQTGDVSVGQAGQTIININFGSAPAEAQAAANHFIGAVETLRTLVMRSSEVREVVVRFVDRFANARRQVLDLIVRKELHDLLHGLQYGELRLLLQSLPVFPENELARPTIEYGWQKLSDIVQAVNLKVDAGAINRADIPWCAQLAKSADEIRAALDTDDKPRLQRTAFRVRSITTTNLSTINTSLYIMADALRRSSLTEQLHALRESLATLAVEPDALRRITVGVDGLSRLLQLLSDMVLLHNEWQRFENELRRVETSLPGDTYDLESSWPDLSAWVTVWCAVEETWAAELRKLDASLADVLKSGRPQELPYLFDRFQNLAGRRFHWIDLRLHEHCKTFDSFREPLDKLEHALP